MFKLKLFLLSTAILVLAANPFAAAAETLHHELQVTLQPEQHRLSVTDTITFPEPPRSPLQFHLHKGLTPITSQPGVIIEKKRVANNDILYDSYTATLPPGMRQLSLQYSGKIYHPLPSAEKEQARGIHSTPGIISSEGAYLSGTSYWYPVLDENSLLSFDLTVELPDGWDAVSQGGRKQPKDNASTRWRSPEPQEEIYLIAARFTRYERSAGRIDSEVWLRTPDEALANRYLDVTGRYLAMYEKLIGPYPYPKFALVENFWETGFGMPSFTLLGSRVIRLPFILHSSYPHEILHNWWGNGVYPDYDNGNWSEGLTAYLADHLIKEQRSQGADYRRDTLQKFTHYVRSERDFPLSQFRSRHSPSSEAVGYGKALMFFHMLRLQLGDETFVEGLRKFYRDHRFERATFDNIRQSFEKVSGKKLQHFFEQWITRSGAPQLKLRDTKVTRSESGDYRLQTVIEQIQPEAGYRLQIPLAITLENETQAWQTTLTLEDKRTEIDLALPARPLRLDLDPEFDLFRRLDGKEIPPAISQILGAEKKLIVLPSAAGEAMRQGYRQLAESLRRAGPEETEIVLDSSIEQLPGDGAITLLGWNNRFLDRVNRALIDYGLNLDGKQIQLGGGKPLERENHSFAITVGKSRPLMWIAAARPQAIPGLGRKLPHYHKYSYLAFEGDEPTNVAKGKWPVLDSPMTQFLPDSSGRIHKTTRTRLAPREALATLPAPFSAEQMLETIRFLSSKKLEGRGFGSKGLEQAANFIAEQFRRSGLQPAGDDGYFQSWSAAGGESGQKAVLKNIIGVIPGNNPAYDGQSVVIAAHYDHLGRGWPEPREERYRGMIHSGADDNASGVAVLLELAHTLSKSLKPQRSIIFAAFSGEEAGRLGSRHYLSSADRYPNGKCIAMINLDTVGRLGDNKLLVLGAESASEWVHIIRGIGFVTGVPMELVKQPLDASDQISFHQAGIPAIQLFSGPNLDYHRPGDTADKIDTAGLINVATAGKEAIEYLAHREQPLTSTLKESKPTGTGQKTSRKVRLGTIPDFAYNGNGVRLSSVAPTSPAAANGLQEGDIIVQIDDKEISDIKALSDLLKKLNPGDTITITYLRDGKKLHVETKVVGK